MNILHHCHTVFTALYVFDFALTGTFVPSFCRGLPELYKTCIYASCCNRELFPSEQMFSL